MFLFSALFALGAALLPARPQNATRPVVTDSLPGTLVKFEMVSIPAGTVTLPDPANPVKTRRVPVKGFWIGRTEVTWDLFDVYAFQLDLTEQQKAAQGTNQNANDASSRPSKPYGAPDRGFGHQGYPALAMTYYNAEQFCKWLSAKTGKKYRLPTEAEWEFAARAEKSDAKPFTDPMELAKFAWFWDNADDKTHPVGNLAPNAWGIYDMLGNVAEWCTGQDGTPVVRGGAFNDKADKVFVGAREKQSPDWNATDPQNPKSKWWLADAPFVGFRIVREE